jgi:hypothetical protein
VENSPDTVLTLINGEKMIVRETSEEILHLIVDFRRLVLAGLPSLGSDLNLVAAQGSFKVLGQLNHSSEGGRRG